MTHVELADRAGVTRQTVTGIEGGKYCPALKVASKITVVFAVAVEDVLQYSEL